ncbi:MIF4G domain-containing protein [Cladophialophora immunda]|nr:MIF4G domain-containing protein [Cladophialophora immunda]
MSRQSARTRNGLKLPFALEKELGLEGRSRPGGAGGGRRQHGSVQSRKEQRKAQRQEKKQNIRGSGSQRRPSVPEQGLSDEDLDEDSADEPVRSSNTSKKDAVKPKIKEDEPKELKSILKKKRNPSPSLSEASLPSRSRSSSPGLVLDANSQAFKERAAQDDAEIVALERKLGLKKRKPSKSFADDGLDDLLEGLDGEDRGVKRKSEEDAWLDRKRRKADLEDDEFSEGNFDLEEGSDDDELEAFEAEQGDRDDLLGENPKESEEEHSDEDLDQRSEDSFEGFESGEDMSDVQPTKVRENPYVPPVPQTPTGKYIPPSLRKAQNSESPSLERLKRQLQGHLNRLSEANLLPILGEAEKLYQSNPRQDVTSVLIDLLLTLFCNKSALSNTFVILHAAYATAVYKVIGVDFGADMLSQLVERFDQYRSDTATGKEALNLISLLCHLFTFHLISSAIIFHYIRLLLERLSENNTELLLRVVRDCGHQLRQDDPSSLKEIVQIMQKEAARMNSAGEQMSVRTKFMIETITDLKNNKMKAATNNAGVASEHITLMRKVLGSLNNSRNVRASEPLRITRDDIKNSDKKGRWWLVGASWKGHEPAAAAAAEGRVDASIPMTGGGLDDDDSVDLIALSRHYGMNTDIRRSIFVALLSAVDYQDAHMRLLKLRLKRTQEQEIPKVLLRCSAGEDPYNHYYTLVARKLCLEKKMRKAFQFALWSFFKRMGENPNRGDEEEEDAGEGDQEVEMTEIANLARLYAFLILDGAETLGVLKVLELAYIKERTAMFVELLLIIMMIEAKDIPDALIKVFERAAETPQIIKRLQFFIKKNVRTSDLVAKKARDVVKRGCQTALETLRKLELIDNGADV